MTDNLEIDRLAEAVAWLKSGEAMMGPRTEAAVSVVLDRLASMIPAGGLAEEAELSRWWVGPEGQRMSPETYAAWAPVEPARAALYRLEGAPQQEQPR